MLYGGSKDFNLEQPLTNLVWITSLVSILVTYAASYALLRDLAGQPDLWWVLSTIISLGTVAGALIPEFTKAFTSTESRHVKEVVTSFPPGRRLAQHFERSSSRATSPPSGPASASSR